MINSVLEKMNALDWVYARGVSLAGGWRPESKFLLGLMSRSPLIAALACGIVLGYGSIIGQGQTAFQAADIPHKSGRFYRVYFNGAEREAGHWAGKKGGPQRWDFSFSQPRHAQEDIHRINIVAVSESGHGKEFLEAGYAKRTTRASMGSQSFRNSYFDAVPLNAVSRFHRVLWSE